MNIAQDITKIIGDTPLVRINSISDKYKFELYGKCEFLNPTSSVKDRLALAMIEDGIEKGLINKDTTIIEPTSGNTGIGLAMVCAAKKIKLTLTMPESMSIERRQILKALGAKLVLTDKNKGMQGSIDEARQLSKKIKNSYIPQQFSNSSNAKKHKETTALEILKDTEADIDIFVAAVGTGGTFTGVAEVLKSYNPNIKVVAVEPYTSAVISNEKASIHGIQGIGAGFIPDVLNTDIIDEIIKVKDEDAIKTSRKVAKKDGLLVGISSGANLWASKYLGSKKENKGKKIVTILCDTGERYLSSNLYK